MLNCHLYGCELKSKYSRQIHQNHRKKKKQSTAGSCLDCTQQNNVALFQFNNHEFSRQSNKLPSETTGASYFCSVKSLARSNNSKSPKSKACIMSHIYMQPFLGFIKEGMSWPTVHILLLHQIQMCCTSYIPQITLLISVAAIAIKLNHSSKLTPQVKLVSTLMNHVTL